jgi:CheY-like chemotaxis protein
MAKRMLAQRQLVINIMPGGCSGMYHDPYYRDNPARGVKGLNLNQRIIVPSRPVIHLRQSCKGWGEAGLSTKSLISIIDDDESYREATKALMKSLGFRVEAFPSALDFLASPHRHRTSCVIADINMPRMTGVELHRHLVESGSAIPVILITAYPDDSGRARAMTDGIIGYLSKPCDEDALLGCIRSALKRTKPDGDSS